MRIIATMARRGRTNKNENENLRKASVTLIVPCKSSFQVCAPLSLFFCFLPSAFFIIIIAVAAV